MAENMNCGNGTMITAPLNCTKMIELDYPGVVRNTSRMLDTLGGEDKLSKAFNDDHAAVGLRFHPDNPYCKSARGIATQSTSLLMKVKRRCRRKEEEKGCSGVDSGNGSSSPSDVQYSADILGLIGHRYKFSHLCDFQYLPCDKEPSGEISSLLEKILPSAGQDVSYMDRDVPPFMLPEAFSRFDTPIEYNYKRNLQPRDTKHQSELEFRAKLIQHGRNKRYHYAEIVKWTDSFKVPLAPSTAAIEHVESLKSGNAKEEIKKLFEERPLWSRNALQCHVDMAPSLVKSILWVVAYYFQQGPWRGLWCRMGYDPRKEPDAKQYQLLDFRVRKELTDKRLKVLFRNKKVIMYPQQSAKHKRRIPTPMIASQSSQSADQTVSKDAYYIMKRGLLPAYHQMFYQLCDLHDPDLQAIINDPKWQQEKPNGRTGYFDAEMFRQLRDALTNMIKDTVLDLDAESHQQDNSPETRGQSTSSASAAGMRNTAVNVSGDDMDDDEDEDVEGLDAVGEDSESENEMAMEMLELMDADTMANQVMN